MEDTDNDELRANDGQIWGHSIKRVEEKNDYFIGQIITDNFKSIKI
jgi:cephalosporin-C deacetylase-like acetyl esterase